MLLRLSLSFVLSIVVGKGCIEGSDGMGEVVEVRKG